MSIKNFSTMLNLHFYLLLKFNRKVLLKVFNIFENIINIY